jgi:hypothetical protein
LIIFLFSVRGDDDEELFDFDFFIEETLSKESSLSDSISFLFSLSLSISLSITLLLSLTISLSLTLLLSLLTLLSLLSLLFGETFFSLITSFFLSWLSFNKIK